MTIKANPKIGAIKYFNDIKKVMDDVLFWDLQFRGCDAIVCLKRSGFMAGAFLSNKMNRPLFTTSEIEKIPGKYQKILLCDDKIWHGRQMRKYEKKLRVKGKSVQTLCLYVEGNVFPDFFVKFIGCKVRLFYEK